MFKFILGLFTGASISLILYSCILINKKSDDKGEK